MSIEIKTPVFPESVAEGSIATWHKKPGEAVARDELLVDIETDKVVLEVVAPTDGSLEKILKQEGDTVTSGAVIALFKEGKVTAANTKTKAETPVTESVTDKSAGPAARKLMAEQGLTAKEVPGSGKAGRVTKEDILKHIDTQTPVSADKAPVVAKEEKKSEFPKLTLPMSDRPERRVPMTRLRARIAERLLQVQHSTATLTTFNEVNMQAVMALRNKYKEAFEKSHGIKLGFMSFFVRAAVEALKRFPEVNASIDGHDVVYHGYYDVSVAVSTERGLVVPVIRDADQKTLAEIEKEISEFAQKARTGKLTIEEITGGTFTITNGGVFGSLMSTPILNSPQTAILGMHKTQERPMAVNSQVVVLPMMYLALSYDHRLIDGKDAVGFLVTIKEFIEDPAKMLLDI